MDTIYLDHAATTPMTASAMAAMLPFFMENYGNASSIHATGRDARKAVERAREQVRKAVGARNPSEVYFTSGGTAFYYSERQ